MEQGQSLLTSAQLVGVGMGMATGMGMRLGMATGMGMRVGMATGVGKVVNCLHETCQKSLAFLALVSCEMCLHFGKYS